MVADVRHRSYSVFYGGISADVVYGNLGGKKMIKCDKGVVVVSGAADTILAELAGIIESVYKSLTDAYSKDAADELIAMVGRVALTGDDAINEEIERLNELLKNELLKEVER